jgi:hypothetical protein
MLVVMIAFLIVASSLRGSFPRRYAHLVNGPLRETIRSFSASGHASRALALGPFILNQQTLLSDFGGCGIGSALDGSRASHGITFC